MKSTFEEFGLLLKKWSAEGATVGVVMVADSPQFFPDFICRFEGHLDVFVDARRFSIASGSLEFMCSYDKCTIAYIGPDDELTAGLKQLIGKRVEDMVSITTPFHLQITLYSLSG